MCSTKKVFFTFYGAKPGRFVYQSHFSQKKKEQNWIYDLRGRALYLTQGAHLCPRLLLSFVIHPLLGQHGAVLCRATRIVEEFPEKNLWPGPDSWKEFQIIKLDRTVNAQKEFAKILMFASRSCRGFFVPKKVACQAEEQTKRARWGCVSWDSRYDWWLK